MELGEQNTFKGGAYSKGSAYWKEGTKLNHYGTYHIKFL